MGLLGCHHRAAFAHSIGATVVDLDAGCCGMAGSFGYTREHYDVSVAIANRRLLPAVKAMKPGDVLVAPGTSCRHQVADLSGAAARASGGLDPRTHGVEWLNLCKPLSAPARRTCATLCWD